MSRHGFGDSKLVRASRIVSSKGAESTAISLIVAFVFFCALGIGGISYQAKLVDENYQALFASTGFSQPRTLDEAVYWMQLAEGPAWSDGPILFTFGPGDSIPRNHSTDYGWSVVAQTVCDTETASVTIVYFVGDQVIEVLDLPVRNADGVWEGNVETKSTRFVAYCNPYNDSVYFTIRLFRK